MYVKVSDWPTVLPDDDGIRPAGPPDACFYCRVAVGGRHGPDCPTVSVLVRFGVYVGGERLGYYDRHMTAGRGMCDWEFQLNEGSWCADNALDGIVWDAGRPPQAVAALGPDEGVGPCSCGVLEFRHEAVIDTGPLVQRPEVVPEGGG